MTRTKQIARPSGSAPAKMRPACSRMQNDEPPVTEATKDDGKKCVSDSEEGSWQDSGDEDMKELFAAEEAETQAQDEAEAQAQAEADEDTLSDDDNEVGAKDPEKKPPAKRARTSDN
jgi:hypothetical protein